MAANVVIAIGRIRFLTCLGECTWNRSARRQIDELGKEENCNFGDDADDHRHPIITVMLSSIPVSHRPMKTAQTARRGINRIAKAIEKLS